MQNLTDEERELIEFIEEIVLLNTTSIDVPTRYNTMLQLPVSLFIGDKSELEQLNNLGIVTVVDFLTRFPKGVNERLDKFRKSIILYSRWLFGG